QGLAMFQKVNVPVLRIVENMSYFVWPGFGRREEIFKHGGGGRHRRPVRLAVPREDSLDSKVALGGDARPPLRAGEPKSGVTEAYLSIADAISRAVGA